MAVRSDGETGHGGLQDNKGGTRHRRGLFLANAVTLTISGRLPVMEGIPQGQPQDKKRTKSSVDGWVQCKSGLGGYHRYPAACGYSKSGLFQNIIRKSPSLPIRGDDGSS